MEPCFFGSPSHQLYAVLPEPVRTPTAVLVFCPPFAEEMVTTYARFANWGKQLEVQGIPVVRFHPFGTGESGGSFCDYTIASAVSDSCTAADLAQTRVSSARVG